MKTTFLNMLIPVIIVGMIFLISHAMQSNYDLRNLQPYQGIALVTAKEIIPAGTERQFVHVGKTLVGSPVAKQEEPTLYVKLEGKDAIAIVDRQQYSDILIGQKISVTYYKPKYYGKPFALHVNN
jgi:hypothetical protein